MDLKDYLNSDHAAQMHAKGQKLVEQQFLNNDLLLKVMDVIAASQFRLWHEYGPLKGLDQNGEVFEMGERIVYASDK